MSKHLLLEMANWFPSRKCQSVFSVNTFTNESWLALFSIHFVKCSSLKMNQRPLRKFCIFDLPWLVRQTSINGAVFPNQISIFMSSRVPDSYPQFVFFTPKFTSELFRERRKWIEYEFSGLLFDFSPNKSDRGNGTSAANCHLRRESRWNREKAKRLDSPIRPVF